MDCKTGKIYELSVINELRKQSADLDRFIEMEVDPTPKQQMLGRVGRNESCPCGSGKKFKHCHLRQ